MGTIIIDSRLIRVIFVAVLLSLLSITSLTAADLMATYEEELSPVIRNNGDFGLVFTKNNYDVAFRVGTLTIYSVGSGNPPGLDEMILDRTGFGGRKSYKLETTAKIGGKDEFKALLVAKITYCNGSRTRVLTIEDNDDELLEEDDVEHCSTPYPITIEFFMVIKGIPDAALAEGVGFQFKHNQSIGNFKLDFESTSGPSVTIPINGNTGYPPFFETDYSSGSDNHWNEVNTTLYVSLAIEQESYQQSIKLLDASGASRAPVGQARLILTGYERSSSQGVTIQFDDGNGSTSNDFLLKHDETPSFILFSLYLADEKVDNGIATPWEDLVYGNTNLKILEVGDIDYQHAISRIAGDYADTIYVTITPLDTNMVGL